MTDHKTFRCHDAEACAPGQLPCQTPEVCGCGAPCPVKDGAYKPADAVHQIAEPQPEVLRHQQELAAYRFTVENREARIAELEAQLEAIGAGGVEPLRKPTPAVLAAPDERAAFEKFIQTPIPSYFYSMIYENWDVNNKWIGWQARAALSATQPAAQGVDDRDVFEHEYAQHAIDYAGIDSTCEEVAKRVKDGRDGNSYKHTHESGAWVGWQLALAAQAKQGAQANG